MNPLDTKLRGLLMSIRDVEINDLNSNIFPEYLGFLTNDPNMVYHGFTTDETRPIDLAVPGAHAAFMIIKSSTK